MSTPTARLPKHIYLATDPFGTPLYDALVSFLKEQQDLKVHELGTGDYYTAAANVGRAVAAAAEAAATRLPSSSSPLHSSSTPITTTNYSSSSSSSSSSSPLSSSSAFGIVICGTGMGVCIAANKVPGIRAAVAENTAAAVNSKSVNNSNVLALGAMITTPEEAKEIVLAWLNAEFKGPAPANKGKGWSEEIQVLGKEHAGLGGA